MSEFIRRVDPSSFAEARLRVLRQNLLRLLTGGQSRARINFQGEEPFCEKVLQKESFRLSTLVADLKSEPTPDTTFILSYFFGDSQASKKVIVVPSQDQAFEVDAHQIRIENLIFQTTYIPTNPDQISQIITSRNLNTRPVDVSEIRLILDYFIS